MPLITVTLIEGYDESVRQTLSERLTDVTCLTIGAPLDGVTVVLNEVPSSNYMRGRQRRVPGTPLASPADLVRGYLSAMENRNLASAKDYLADAFTMTFPGGLVFETPEQLIDWSKQRYRYVKKTYHSFDQLPADRGSIVYCHGTLNGEWTDGTAFSDIRFIDRFMVEEGKLTDQRVWNDLAEQGLRDSAGLDRS